MEVRDVLRRQEASRYQAKTSDQRKQEKQIFNECFHGSKPLVNAFSRLGECGCLEFRTMFLLFSRTLSFVGKSKRPFSSRESPKHERVWAQSKPATKQNFDGFCPCEPLPKGMQAKLTGRKNGVQLGLASVPGQIRSGHHAGRPGSGMGAGHGIHLPGRARDQRSGSARHQFQLTTVFNLRVLFGPSWPVRLTGTN